MEEKTLREWRDEQRLTQEQLEALCAQTPTALKKNIRLSQTAISNIEIARVTNPNWTTVIVLAEALGIDPRQIILDADSEKQSRLPLKRGA